MDLTAHIAASCVRACEPLPMIAAVFASWRAMYRVATPLAAPVRTAPRALAAMKAIGSAVSMSYSSTTIFERAPAPVT